jgi:hemoglobin-like flavoprotein
MTPEQIGIVQAVVGQLGGRAEFAERFYGRLFEAAPQTRAMFPDVASQQRKLADELQVMVSLLDDLGTLEVRARELGERHRGYGVRAGDYRLAREVMVASIHDVLGDGFGPDEEAAWNRATSLIAELMMSS